MKRDETKLPKWAQDLIGKLRADVTRAIDDRDRMARASAVLDEREWFTLQTWGDESRTFFMLRNDAATPICTLHGKDMLLVGRHRK